MPSGEQALQLVGGGGDPGNGAAVAPSELQDQQLSASTAEHRNGERIDIDGAHEENKKKLKTCVGALKEMSEVLSRLQTRRVTALPKHQATMGQLRLANMMRYEDRLTQIIRGKDPKHKAPSHRSVIEYVEDQIERAQACVALPFVLFMLMCFCFSAFGHLELENMHHVDRAFYFDLSENANFAFDGNTPFEDGRMGHKGFADVNNIPDFWSWLNLGLIPLYFPAPNNNDPDNFGVQESRSLTATMCNSWKDALMGAGWPSESITDVSEEGNMYGRILKQYPGKCPEGNDMPVMGGNFFGEPGRKTHTYLYYHSIIVGLRMRQERTDPVTCADESLLGKVFSGHCLPLEPDYSVQQETRTGLFLNEDLVPGPDKNGRTVYLLSHTSQTDLLKQTRQLENEVWFSPYASKVELLFTTYNPHLNVFTANFIILYISRAGHFYKRIEPVSFFLLGYRNWTHYLWDVLWILSVGKIMCEEIIEIFKKIQHDGCYDGLLEYLGFGNFIDWINVLYAITILIVWFWHIGCLSNFRSTLENADATVPGSFQSEDDRDTFYQQVVVIVRSIVILRRVMAFYPFVIVSRFLKIFSYQPRLALVTNTLAQASTDIIHFGVVFMVVFAVYTVSAMMLFGQELDNFTGVDRATNSVFQILLGDFDYDELVLVGRLDTTLWFISFMLLVNLIMLNMLLAIVLDVYTEVKGGLGEHCETLWSQAFSQLARWRRTRAKIDLPLTDILEKLDPPVDDDDEKERKVSTKLAEDADEGATDVKLESKARLELGDVIKIRNDETEEQEFRKIAGISPVASMPITLDKPLAFSYKAGDRVSKQREKTEEKPLTLAMFKQIVPAMNEAQAETILRAAFQANQQSEGTSISETNKSVAEMEDEVKDVARLVDNTFREVSKWLHTSNKATQDYGPRRRGRANKGNGTTANNAQAQHGLQAQEQSDRLAAI